MYCVTWKKCELIL